MSVGKYKTCWDEYLLARHKLVHEWHQHGIPGFTNRMTAEQIAAQLNHADPMQVVLLVQTPLPPEPTTLAEIEEAAIKRAIRREDGNITAACKVLGLGRSTVQRKVKAWREKGWQP